MRKEDKKKMRNEVLSEEQEMKEKKFDQKEKMFDQIKIVCLSNNFQEWTI